MFNKCAFFITVTGLIFSTVAQNIEGVNARLDAMGGSGVADDIGWTVDNPRSIVDWPDRIQGSAIIKNIMGKGETFGRIIAIKSIGDKICVGITANNNKLLRSGFYKDAGDFLNATVDLEIGELNENFQTLPHINFGMKISNKLNLGAGFFLERTSFEKTVTDTLNGILDSVNEKSITMAGGIIDAKVVAGPITFVPQLRFGFPGVKGLDENKHPNNEHKYEYSSDAGLYLRPGLMWWWKAAGTFLIAGVWYTNETYQFNKGIGSRDSLGYEFKNNIIDWFIGCQPSFSDNLYLAPEYDGGIEISKQIASDTMIAADQYVRDSTIYYSYHDFRFGLEKPLGKIWIFDVFTPRAGFAYKIVKEKIVITSSVDKDLYESVEVKTTKTNLDELASANEGLKVTAGIGLRKGRATLDISADLLRWKNTFISGPSSAMATLTFDISKHGGSEGSTETAPAPAPEPAISPDIDETAPEPEFDF